MCDVSAYTADDWRRLGRAIKRRRIAMKKSQQEMADLAGIGVNTWAGIESGDRKRRDLTLSAIDDALAWESGSCLDILEHKDPTLREAVPAPRDELRYDRPDGIPDQDWEELKAKFDADYEFWLRFRRRD